MVFVDTWAWLALAYKKDPYHASAARQHHELRKRKRRYVTTDYVLTELISALFRVLPYQASRQFVAGLLKSIADGHHQLVFITPETFEKAWQLRQKYHDKPDISFVDLISMVVMQDLGITEVFTGDQHFLHVGLGFQLIP